MHRFFITLFLAISTLFLSIVSGQNVSTPKDTFESNDSGTYEALLQKNYQDYVRDHPPPSAARKEEQQQQSSPNWDIYWQHYQQEHNESIKKPTKTPSRAKNGDNKRNSLPPSFSEKEQSDEANSKFETAKDSIALLFPRRKPRDLLDGLGKALRTIVLGCCINVAAIIGIPVLNFVQDGLVSAVLGLVASVFVVIFVSVGSLLLAVRHLLAGLLATPHAIHAWVQGKTWDATVGQWLNYDLQQDARAILARQTQNQAHTVKDLTFYNRLNVTVDATFKDIKKAYYRQAKDVHPDKRTFDDESANEQFVKLHQAYTILSDDRLRQHYDKFGISNSSKNEYLDSVFPFDFGVFFAVLFDAQALEPYVGQLRVAFYANKLTELAVLMQSQQRDDKDLSSLSMDQLNAFVQGWTDETRLRRVDIARHLLVLIGPYVNGSVSKAEFQEKCRREAAKIADTAFGVDYLKAIGLALTGEANLVVGRHIRALIQWPVILLRTALKRLRRTGTLLLLVKRSFSILRTFEKEVLVDVAVENVDDFLKTRTQKTLQVDQDSLHKLLPKILDTAWLYIERDIAGTLEGACHKLFADVSSLTTTPMSKASRRQRKRQALKILGQAFLEKRLEILLLQQTDPCQNGNSNSTTRCDNSTRKNRQTDSIDRLEHAFKLAMLNTKM